MDIPAKRAGKTPCLGARRAKRDVFERVEALARNLWWTWNPGPQRLFAAIDPVWWEASNHNPIRTLAELTPERRAVLREDAGFLALLCECERQLVNKSANGENG